MSAYLAFLVAYLLVQFECLVELNDLHKDSFI